MLKLRFLNILKFSLFSFSRFKYLFLSKFLTVGDIIKIEQMLTRVFGAVTMKCSILYESIVEFQEWREDVCDDVQKGQPKAATSCTLLMKIKSKIDED